MKAQTFDDLYREAEAHDDYWVAGCVQDFTEELFELMERRGMTRSELARRLGTSPAYVTKILRGNTNFTLATMVRLARALGAELQVHLKPKSSDRRRVRDRPSAQGAYVDSRQRPALAASATPGRVSTR